MILSDNSQVIDKNSIIGKVAANVTTINADADYSNSSMSVSTSDKKNAMSPIAEELLNDEQVEDSCRGVRKSCDCET